MTALLASTENLAADVPYATTTFDLRGFLNSTSHKSRCAFFAGMVVLHTAVHMFMACVQSGTPHW